MTASVPTVALGDGLEVSAIGFGAMALTPIYGAVDDSESLATLNHCLDVGVTFIDTANIYGGVRTSGLSPSCWRTAATR
jgi:aryl-alcohol dehydrogenase-like predicted oxidoreductase